MNPCILLTSTILLAVLNGAGLHKLNRFTRAGEVAAMNAFVACIWAFLLTVFGVFSMDIHRQSIMWGVIFGFANAGFLFTKTQALALGPIGPTTIIGSCSMLIPSLGGAAFLDEKISTVQGVGLALLLVSLFMNTGFQKSTRGDGSWRIYCLAFFLFSGLTGISMKLFQASPGRAETGMMLWISALTSAILFTLISLRGSAMVNFLKTSQKRDWLCVALCGVFSCIYSYINIGLSGRLPGVVFFPVYNGGVIYINTIIGRVLFGEKLSTVRITGLAFGLVAIMLLGGVFNGILGTN